MLIDEFRDGDIIIAIVDTEVDDQQVSVQLLDDGRLVNFMPFTNRDAAQVIFNMLVAAYELGKRDLLAI